MQIRSANAKEYSLASTIIALNGISHYSPYNDLDEETAWAFCTELKVLYNNLKDEFKNLIVDPNCDLTDHRFILRKLFIEKISIYQKFPICFASDCLDEAETFLSFCLDDIELITNLINVMRIILKSDYLMIAQESIKEANRLLNYIAKSCRILNLDDARHLNLALNIAAFFQDVSLHKIAIEINAKIIEKNFYCTEARQGKVISYLAIEYWGMAISEIKLLLSDHYRSRHNNQEIRAYENTLQSCLMQQIVVVNDGIQMQSIFNDLHTMINQQIEILEIDDEKLLNELYPTLALIYFEQGNYLKSFEYSQGSLKVLPDIKNTYNIFDVLNLSLAIMNATSSFKLNLSDAKSKLLSLKMLMIDSPFINKDIDSNFKTLDKKDIYSSIYFDYLFLEIIAGQKIEVNACDRDLTYAKDKSTNEKITYRNALTILHFFKRMLDEPIEFKNAPTQLLLAMLRSCESRVIKFSGKKDNDFVTRQIVTQRLESTWKDFRKREQQQHLLTQLSFLNNGDRTERRELQDTMIIRCKNK